MDDDVELDLTHLDALNEDKHAVKRSGDGKGQVDVRYGPNIPLRRASLPITRKLRQLFGWKKKEKLDAPTCPPDRKEPSAPRFSGVRAEVASTLASMREQWGQIPLFLSRVRAGGLASVASSPFRATKKWYLARKQRKEAGAGSEAEATRRAWSESLLFPAVGLTTFAVVGGIVLLAIFFGLTYLPSEHTGTTSGEKVAQSSGERVKNEDLSLGERWVRELKGKFNDPRDLAVLHTLGDLAALAENNQSAMLVERCKSGSFLRDAVETSCTPTIQNDAAGIPHLVKLEVFTYHDGLFMVKWICAKGVYIPNSDPDVIRYPEC